MRHRVSRRGFLGAAGAAAAAAAAPSSIAASSAPAVHVHGAARPAAAGSHNGLRAVRRAMELVSQGTDTLDASCMQGPTRRAGAVATLEGITPTISCWSAKAQNDSRSTS